MTPQAFEAQWQSSLATVCAASQQQFLNLCRIRVVTSDGDPTGGWLAFPFGRGEGFAEIRNEGHFPCEYRGNRPKGRTITSYYNRPPSWPLVAHRDLDDGVFVAYGWPVDLTDHEVLARLLALSLQREPA